MKTLFALMLVMFTSMAYSQEFMGVKVDGPVHNTVTMLKSKGFALVTSFDNQYVLTGDAGTETDVTLYVVATPISKKTWKIMVAFEKQTSWYSLESQYKKYLNLLTSKYGTPKGKYEYFRSPYEKGDGYELTAVSADKCVYNAFWDEVWMEISEKQRVNIHYENPVNSELNVKEKNSVNSKVF